MNNLNTKKILTPDELFYLSYEEARVVNANASKESQILGHNEKELVIHNHNCLNKGAEDVLKGYKEEYYSVPNDNYIISSAFNRFKKSFKNISV